MTCTEVIIVVCRRYRIRTSLGCVVEPNLGSAVSRLLYGNARERRSQDSTTNANITVDRELIIVVGVQWLFIASRLVRVTIFASRGSVTLANHSTFAGAVVMTTVIAIIPPSI